MKKILLSLFLLGLINYGFAQIPSKNDAIEKSDLFTFAVDSSIVRFQYTGYPDVKFELSGPKGPQDIKPIANVGFKVFFYEIDKSELDSTYLEVKRVKDVGASEVIDRVSLSEILARRPFPIETEISGLVYTSKYRISIDTHKKEIFGKSVIEFSITAMEKGPLVWSGGQS